jgi:hypothetical protein
MEYGQGYIWHLLQASLPKDASGKKAYGKSNLQAIREGSLLYVKRRTEKRTKTPTTFLSRYDDYPVKHPN